MGKSWKENVYKKNFGGKKNTNQKHRGKTNKELSLVENGYSEDDMDLSYQNGNNVDQYGNQRN